MKKVIMFLLVMTSVFVLSSCTVNKDLQTVGLDGMTGKEILLGVADGSVVVEGFNLSVYDDELIVITDSKRISVDMPKDEFYVSVAPYIETTHECLFHSATGCRGEMKNEDFYVTFVDESGSTLISENMTSLDNGFIDLWLPRDIEGTLTITHGELSVTKVISTEAGQPTCETTMKLQ